MKNEEYKYFKILIIKIFRIENIEFLDERELLTQLLEHYCLLYAFKDKTQQRTKLANLVVH